MDTLLLLFFSIVGITFASAMLYFIGHAVRKTDGHPAVIVGAGYLAMIGFSFLSLGILGVGTFSGLEHLLMRYSGRFDLNALAFIAAWLMIAICSAWAGYRQKTFKDLLRNFGLFKTP